MSDTTDKAIEWGIGIFKNIFLSIDDIYFNGGLNEKEKGVTR